MSEAYVDPTKEQFAHFRALNRSGKIHMLNLVRLRTTARYEDGRSVTGEEAYDAYADAAAEPFRRVGGRQFWAGRFELTVIGPPGEPWDRVFIAEYPSFEAFVEMLRDPVYRAAVKHRQAAVVTSRLIRLEPFPPSDRFGK